MTNDVDKLVRDYLEAVAEERAKGVTLADVARTLKTLADDRIKDRQMLAKVLGEIRDEFQRSIALAKAELRDEFKRRHDRHGNRIEALEGKVAELTEHAPAVENWKPDPREITGTFEFREVMRDYEERKSDHRWLKRKQIEWVVAGVGAVVLLALGALGTLIMSKIFGVTK